MFLILADAGGVGGGHRCGWLELLLHVQADMFVEIRGITERPATESTAERLHARMRAYVNLQAVLAGVHLATVDARVQLAQLGAMRVSIGVGQVMMMVVVVIFTSMVMTSRLSLTRVAVVIVVQQTFVGLDCWLECSVHVET